jgi:hypothetical protein
MQETLAHAELFHEALIGEILAFAHYLRDLTAIRIRF